MRVRRSDFILNSEEMKPTPMSDIDFYILNLLSLFRLDKTDICVNRPTVPRKNGLSPRNRGKVKKINLSLCVNKHHFIKTYRRMELLLHLF
jgi:hypothetical protein